MNVLFEKKSKYNNNKFPFEKEKYRNFTLIIT